MRFDNLQKGEYIIDLTVKAVEDTVVHAFTNHRRFLLSGRELKKGESVHGKFAVALRDADFQKQPEYRDDFVEVKVTGDCTFEAKIEKVNLPAIYCLGDSTVCDQPYEGGDELSRCCGWGQTLSMYLGDKFAVSDHAEQGTHTADCLSCHIKPVLEQLREGDIVLAQFGHNDQKQDWLKAFGGYRENLIKIANEVGQRGGKCVLCTPINRLIYVDGKLNTYLDEYAVAVRSAAEELGLGCIDLHGFTSRTYEEMGTAAENLFYHPDGPLDRTHPNDLGGKLIGEYVSSKITEA